MLLARHGVRCVAALGALPPPRRDVPTATHVTLAANAVLGVATGDARDGGVVATLAAKRSPLNARRQATTPCVRVLRL